MQTQSNQSASLEPLFSLGQVMATPGALARLAAEQIPAVALLRRHVVGDWGDCGTEDTQTNNDQLKAGGRLFSVYYLDGSRDQDKRVWIITEADRSVTTILLPEEY